MTNPAISRLKAAMKAAALVNQSTDIAKHRAGETGADSLEASKAPAQNQQASASKLLKGGLFGLRDRLIVDRRSGGRPILIRGWHQALALGSAAALSVGSVMIIGIGLFGLMQPNLRDLEVREQALRTALTLVADEVLDQQLELVDATASRSGYIFVESGRISVDSLMADNERLLSTLEAALDALDTSAEGVSTGPLGNAFEHLDTEAGTGSNAGVFQRLEYELALSLTQTDMLAAELRLERQTIESLSESLAAARVDAGVLERKAHRLTDSVQRQDQLIAVLRRDLASVQSDQATQNAARRDTIGVLNDQNDGLMSELRTLRSQMDDTTGTLRSLQAQLVESEAEQARLTALVEQRDVQIAILTDTQTGILEQLEVQANQQMAALQEAINLTGVDNSSSLQLDALLESVQDPFWNGMGGADDGSARASNDGDWQSLSGDDPAAALVTDILDRVDTLMLAHAQLEAQRSHFNALPTYPPVDGLRLSSGYGMRRHPVTGKNRMHKGLDFAGPSGTEVVASASGRVVYAARKGSYGNLIELDHGNGVTTRYAHLRDIEVSTGDIVEMGERIGTVGSTGASTGPHLHWEVRVFERAKNPQLFLEAGRVVRGN